VEETLMVIDLSKANGEKASIAIGANLQIQQNPSSSQKDSRNTQPLTPRKSNR
jgi:hypothetical protein